MIHQSTVNLATKKNQKERLYAAPYRIVILLLEQISVTT